MSGQDPQMLLEKLQQLGDAHKLHAWLEGTPDYVAQLGVTAADIPALLAIAARWADEDSITEVQD